MTPVLRGRRLLAAILALGLGGFGIGVTEFTIMGLSQEVAAGLDVSISTGGNLISAYALGVVVGAPLITVACARMPRKQLALGLMALFTLGNLSSVIAPDYATMLITRFISGLPHGAYFGIAAIIAASLVPSSMRGRAIAWVMLGLSVANVLGVPLVTRIGQSLGWRWMFVAVAVIGVLTFVAILRFVPFAPAEEGTSMKRELSALARPQVWLAMGTGIVGFGGFFAVYAYISPIMTDVAGLPLESMPFILALYGIGMVAGSILGGRLADWSVRGSVLAGLIVVILVQLAFWALAPYAVPILILTFVLGAAGSMLVPGLQTLLMDSAPGAQSLAASLNHSALNVANALGAALGGVVLQTELGLRGTALAGAGLAVAGLVIAVIALLAARRGAARRLPTLG